MKTISVEVPDDFPEVGERREFTITVLPSQADTLEEVLEGVVEEKYLVRLEVFGEGDRRVPSATDCVVVSAPSPREALEKVGLLP